MGLIGKTIEGIIILSLAAGAVLYVHSTYMAAKRQNEIPVPLAAWSKFKKDTRDMRDTGKEISDYVAGDFDEAGIVRKMEEYEQNEKASPSDDQKYLPD
jgi:hypothetical protein